MSIIDKLNARIMGEISAIDTDQAYDDMLGECYSFEKIGGVFASMVPSTVLEKCDPIAYRCGKTDYVDSQGWIEFDDGYRTQDDCERVRDELLDELRSELESEEEELEDEQERELEDRDQDTVTRLLASIEALRAQIEELENHSF